MTTLLPVLDLKGGVPVRARAGKRDEYRPVGGTALDAARAYRARVGHGDLYVADLDAIAGAEPAWDVVAALHGDGFALWLDAGVAMADRADALAAAGVEYIVVGLETVAGPAVVAAVIARHGDRVVFSLDLRDGVPIRSATTWRGTDPRSITDEAVGLGVRRLLVLDLARVGVGEGTGTEALLAELHAAHPAVELLAGGGVRDRADLERLAAVGVGRVLVASALRDGTLGV